VIIHNDTISTPIPYSRQDVVQKEQNLLKLLVYLFIVIKEALVQLDSQPRIQTPGSCSDTVAPSSASLSVVEFGASSPVHTQLRYAGIDPPTA
jgi:hypothetical protein